jgi:Rod binding domain-containing protein
MQIDTTTALYSAQSKVPQVNKDVDDAALKAQTDKFESLMLKTLLDTSMKDEDPLYGKSPGDKIYKSMYREQVAEVSSGGFGLSELLFNFLKENR